MYGHCMEQVIPLKHQVYGVSLIPYGLNDIEDRKVIPFKCIVCGEVHAVKLSEDLINIRCRKCQTILRI